MQNGEENERHGDDERQRGRVAERAGVERLVIHPRENRLRLVHRLAAGDHLDGRKDVEAADGQHDEREEDRRLDAGQRHIEELLECAAAVDPGRFIQLLRDALQRGQKYDQIPSDALPDAEHHRHRQTAPAAVEPANVGHRQVQHVREHIVEHPLGVENVPEDERDDDPRGNDRDVIDHAERDAEARDGIDEHCGQETQDHLPRHGHERVDQRICKCNPERLVGEHVDIVLQPDELLVQHRAEIPLQKAHVQELDDGVDREQCEDQKPRKQQKADLKTVAF